LAYLITLHEKEALSVQQKIETGDVIGLDAVIVATSPEFDALIEKIKQFKLTVPPTVAVISSNQVITVEKVARL
jgi:SepF-like predicted cell division protein (DUF552 family)